MAGVYFHVNSGEVALAAATAKTVLQIKAPANQRVLLSTLRVLGKQSAGGTDTPIKVRITRSTASFGTGSAATPAKNDPSDAEAIQTTAAANFTVEPTTPTDGGLWYEVNAQGGIIEGFEQPLKIPGGQALNVEATSPGTPTLAIVATCQE